MDPEKQCEFIKPDGTRCKMAKMRGFRFCFTHEPSNKTKRLEATKKGGRAIKKPVYIPEELKDINSLQDVAEVLSETYQEVRRSEIQPSVSQAITGICGQFIKLYEVLSLDERLRKLEDRLGDNS